jgi:hypothetical protein
MISQPGFICTPTSTSKTSSQTANLVRPAQLRRFCRKDYMIQGATDHNTAFIQSTEFKLVARLLARVHNKPVSQL